MGMKAHFLLSLGCHSKQAGDERDVPCDIPLFHPVDLPLADHVHTLVAL